MPETVLTAWGLMELGEGWPMPEPERGQCRGCGADVLWVRTAATGALMPVDVSPDPGGNVVLRDGLAHVLSGGLFGEAADEPRYRAHHSVCPEAKRFRRRK